MSRVSKARVLEQTGQQPLTNELAKQQLMLYSRVARQLTGSLMREGTFCPGSLRPTVGRYVRKDAHPRLDWTLEVGDLALKQLVV